MDAGDCGLQRSESIGIDMNRNDREIERLAKKHGWGTKDVPNKLHQIKHCAATKKRPKINPAGRTILVKDNEVL